MGAGVFTKGLKRKRAVKETGSRPLLFVLDPESQAYYVPAYPAATV